MFVYCLKNEDITPAVEYSLNHILNQLGYFFKWIDSAKHLQENAVLIIYGRIEQTVPADIKNIIIIPSIGNLSEINPQTIQWQEIKIESSNIPVFGMNKGGGESKQEYFCDLAANVYFHLARLDEQHITHPDQMFEHEEQSILFKYGKYTVPVVDILIKHFGNFIEQSLGPPAFLIRKAAYPIGEAYGLAVTHDVDTIAAFHRPKKFLLKILSLLKIYSKHSAAEMDEADKKVWGFDKLLPFYREKKIKASFFFMARFREGRHFRYRIQRQKFKEVFEQLKSDGHETALHPSRFAFDYPKRYSREKKRLEKYSQQSILGMRCHYLRGLYPQIWQATEKLGLEYDATLIHRHYSGFRSGICRPFPVFDVQQNKALPIAEFPTTFFENTLPQEGRDIDASLKVIKDLLEKTKKYNGLLTILWHTNNLYYNDPYPRLWQKIWELLDDEEYFSGTLKDHLKWFKQRNEIRLEINGNNMIFSIPEDLKEFCLIFPHDNFMFECADEYVDLSFIGSCLTIKKSFITNSIILKVFLTENTEITKKG